MANDPKKSHVQTVEFTQVRIVVKPIINCLYAIPSQTNLSVDTQISVSGQRFPVVPFVDDLPPYDWGEAGPPQTKPVKYDPEKGFVVIEE